MVGSAIIGSEGAQKFYDGIKIDIISFGHNFLLKDFRFS